MEPISSLLLFAQASAPAPAVEAVRAADPAGPPMWLLLLVVFLAFVLPFVLGALIARALRLPDLTARIGTVLCTLCLGLTPFGWQYVVGHYEQQHYQEQLAKWEEDGSKEGEKPRRPDERTWRDAIRLGIDLAGGTNLVYEVDEEQAEKEITDEIMNQMVGAIGRRINPSGTEEVVVRRVGGRRIEVIIPGADPEVVRQKKGEIQRTGSLEFAILANDLDHREIIEQAQGVDRDLVRAGGRVVASWRPVGKSPNGEPKEVGAGGGVATREVNRDGETVQEFLVVFEAPDRRVTGTYLSRAFQTTDESGRLAVGFNFDTTGGFLFQSLTNKYRPRADGSTRRLAVLLDGQIHSAPELQAVISDQGIISGRFTKAEVAELINVLNAGALEVPLKRDPISEQSISPLLGHDVQTKGIRAIVVSVIVVFAFMVGYYVFAGMIADLCLLLNIIIIMGAMALINATFTLPGMAGIVLTIGMAVDSNVLIFERMREELARGSSLRMAIQNGFDRALSAIIDSNITTLITAVVLYMIGTDTIKGFAVTLFIGLTASLFTAIFFGRMMFEIWERKRWLSKLRMFSFIGATRWDFVSKQKYATIFSGIVILIGLAAFAVRGDENYDIDFTGGTMVTFEFTEPQEIDEIRGILQQSELGNSISLEQLQLFGEETGGASIGSGEGRRFRLRTTETNIGQVRETINSSLTEAGHDLRRVTVEYGEIGTIAQNEPAAEEGADEPVNAAELEYAGGYRVPLTFSDDLKVTTAEDYFIRALEEQNIENARALFAIEGTAAAGDEGAEIASYTGMVLRARPELKPETLQAALAEMQQTMAAEPIFDEVNTFDATVASEMKWTAVTAVLVSIIAIVAYLWFRFENVSFGLAATVAVIHDAVFVLAILPLASWLSTTPVGRALLLDDFKINLTMVAAFMTLIGYSLNDTIVIFDRIREIRGKNPQINKDMVNLAMNQTLARTILTSLLTFLVVATLYVFGGEGIHGFAFCLFIGILVGCYSTIYIASPVLLWLMNRQAAPGRPVTTSPGRAVAAR